MPVLVPVPFQAVIDVVNGWSHRVRAESGQDTAAYPPSPDLPDGRLHPDHCLDVHLAAIADRLHDVFAAGSPRDRLGALNEVIRRADPTPVVSPDGVRWLVGDDVDELEARLVLALVEYAREDPTLARLGTCGAHGCVDVYLDRSQGGTRRYCSVTCQNRAKVAAYRQHRR